MKLNNIKRILAVAVVSAMAVGVTACGGPQVTQVPEGAVVNPMTECKNIDEVNAHADTEILPKKVPGATDESFCVIETDEGTIGEYSLKLNDVEYCVRSARGVEKDISGIYVGSQKAFKDGITDETEFVLEEKVKACRWFEDDLQYVLIIYSKDNLLEADLEEAMTMVLS